MWNKTQYRLPEENEVVDTKIDNLDGIRNEVPLMFKQRMWWHTDGSMYVYYTPTHWKPLAVAAVEPNFLW